MIAAALQAQKNTPVNYPVSQLSHDNEGYWGRLDYPARANHRVVALTLGGEPWFSNIHRMPILMNTQLSFQKQFDQCVWMWPIW